MTQPTTPLFSFEGHHIAADGTVTHVSDLGKAEAARPPQPTKPTIPAAHVSGDSLAQLVDAPEFVAFSGGECQSMRVNGIDFTQTCSYPIPPQRPKRTYRIGNRLVPRWLYELTLEMAKQVRRS